MNLKSILKATAVAVIATGVVITAVYCNRSTRVMREKDNDSVELENIDGDVLDPTVKLFSFPNLVTDGLKKNLIDGLRGWRSNHRAWCGYRQLRIAGALASGGYGQVSVAFDDDEREVALKTINKDVLNIRGPDFIKREVDIMSKMKHPNLVPLLASFETETTVGLIMKRARFGNVKELLQHNDYWLEESMVAKIMMCAARGLAHMHKCKVIHRDIKPANMVIESWKPVLNVQVCDFGEAERKGTREMMGYVGGTKGHCSPEYMEGKNYGPWIDMWSLGVSMYELLFGELPFPQEEAGWAEIRLEDRGLSDGARDLLLKLLDRDPERRIDARGVLKHPWIQKHCFRNGSESFYDLCK